MHHVSPSEVRAIAISVGILASMTAPQLPSRLRSGTTSQPVEACRDAPTSRSESATIARAGYFAGSEATRPPAGRGRGDQRDAILRRAQPPPPRRLTRQRPTGNSRSFPGVPSHIR